jgi:hypothetical protein
VTGPQAALVYGGDRLRDRGKVDCASEGPNENRSDPLHSPKMLKVPILTFLPAIHTHSTGDSAEAQ